MKLKGHKVAAGKAEGEAVVSPEPFSFLGDISPDTGVCNIKRPELDGKSLIGKIIICPTGKGSTRGPLTAYRAAKNKVAPAGIICKEAEPVLAAGAIAARIPMIDRLKADLFKVIQAGDWIKMDADKGTVEVVKR
ncbi:MAG: DUF126 domain-containing protein [Thermodesulfobacteriota bacterium]|jgi:predicted aconitase with swiveling domain